MELAPTAHGRGAAANSSPQLVQQVREFCPAPLRWSKSLSFQFNAMIALWRSSVLGKVGHTTNVCRQPRLIGAISINASGRPMSFAR